MSDDKLTSPEARPLIDSFVTTDPHSTRPLHSSTSPDSPRPIEAEETAIVEDRTLLIVLAFIIIVIAIFFAYMVYIRVVAKRKKRALEETRRRISETVVTAGKGSYSSARSQSQSKEKAKKMSGVDENELRSFNRTGPLIMQARVTGEIKHALQDSPSKSLREPVTFHPSMNEIAIIGTDVDRIVGKRSSEDMEDRAKATKKKVRISKKSMKAVAPDVCVTQPSPPKSFSKKWFPLVTAVPAKSTGKTTPTVESAKKPAKKPTITTTETEDKSQKEESERHASPDTHTSIISPSKSGSAEGKKPVESKDKQKSALAIAPHKEKPSSLPGTQYDDEDRQKKEAIGTVQLESNHSYLDSQPSQPSSQPRIDDTFED